MDDTENTETPEVETQVPAVEPPSESFWQELEDKMGLLKDEAVQGIEALEAHFEADVWPYVKSFLATIASQGGQAFLKAAIAALPTLAAGGFGAAAIQIGTAVSATVIADAPADAEKTLQQIQGALQVVKVATNTVTTGDAPTVQAVTDATQASE